jgi:hypothetical protein
MKPIREHLLISVFLIALLIPPPRVWAETRIHLDGYASLYFLCAYQDIIGCEVEVSGDKSPYLLAYNTRTKNVSWRRKIDHLLFNPCVSDKGKFFFIEDNYLHCINVLNGKTLHVIDLRTLHWPPIPEPDNWISREFSEIMDELRTSDLSPEYRQALKNEIKALEERLIEERQNATSATIEIWYPTLALTPTSLFIGRRISIATTRDPKPKLHSEDWILLDLDTYKFKRSGEGERIFGRVSPEELILGKPSSSDFLSSLKNNTTKDMKPILDKDRPGWSMRFSNVLSEELASHDNRCLIEFIQHSKDDSATIKADWEHYALYDSRTENFSYLGLEPIKGDYTDLFLLSTNLVRYSRCSSESTKTNSSFVWIESLDFKGNRVARRILSDIATYRYFSFCGRTTKSDVVFSDSSMYDGSCAEDPQTATGGVVVVEIPSLRIKAEHRFPVDPGEFHIKALSNSDQIVHVIGNEQFPKMYSESQPHQLIVRGLDVYSGKELWRFKEDVVIRKLKDE